MKLATLITAILFTLMPGVVTGGVHGDKCDWSDPDYPCTVECLKSGTTDITCSCPGGSFITQMAMKMGEGFDYHSDDFYGGIELACDKPADYDSIGETEDGLGGSWPGTGSQASAGGTCGTGYFMVGIYWEWVPKNVIKPKCRELEVADSEPLGDFMTASREVARSSTGAWGDASVCPENAPFASGFYGWNELTNIYYMLRCGDSNTLLPNEYPIIMQPQVDAATNPVVALFVDVEPGKKELDLNYRIIFEGESAWDPAYKKVNELATGWYEAINYRCYCRTSDVEEFQIFHLPDGTPDEMSIGSWSDDQDWYGGKVIPLPVSIVSDVSIEVFDDDRQVDCIKDGKKDKCDWRGRYGPLYVNTPNHLLGNKNNNGDLFDLEKWTEDRIHILMGDDAAAELFARTSVEDRSDDSKVGMLDSFNVHPGCSHCEACCMNGCKKTLEFCRSRCDGKDDDCPDYKD